MTLSLDKEELEYLEKLLEGRACDLDNMIRYGGNNYTSNKEHLETNINILQKIRNELKRYEPVTISREDANKMIVLLGYTTIYGEYALEEKERLIKLLRNDN